MNLDRLIQSAAKQNLNILNIVVRQNGEIVAGHDFAEEQRVLLWSASKTFTSMAIGIAEGEGLLKVEDPISRYFSIPSGPFWDRLTIHDLLCMGTGQVKCPFTEAWNAAESLEDVEGIFFREPVVYEPGTHFMYNNAATYMLSKLITLRSGSSLNDYLRPRLFTPLGFDDVHWEHNREGVNYGCSGLYLSAHEVSKFGQLLLNEGTWQGSNLIPADYIRRAGSKQIDNSDFDEPFATSDHHAGYGYQVWMNSYPGSYRLDGLYGQYTVVIPEKQAVVTYISNESKNMTAILELTWNFIVEQL